MTIYTSSQPDIDLPNIDLLTLLFGLYQHPPNRTHTNMTSRFNLDILYRLNDNPRRSREPNQQHHQI